MSVDPHVGKDMSSGFRWDAEVEKAARRWCLDGSGLSRGGIGEHRGRRRHLVRHLRHHGAEANHQRGKDHYVTHHATLDEVGNITTSAAKPRPMAATKEAILTKRMSEVLTGTTREAVNISPTSSSGARPF